MAGNSILDDTESDLPVAVPRRLFATGRLVRRCLVLAVVIAASLSGWHYWKQSQLYLTTDNAYVNANLTERVAELHNAQSNVRRSLDLITRNLLSKESAEAVSTQAATAAAAVKAAEANLAQVESTLGKVGERNAAIRAALARFKQTQLDLSFTKVIAPASGLIANFTRHDGQRAHHCVLTGKPHV